MQNDLITTDLAFFECHTDEFPTFPRASCFALALNEKKKKKLKKKNAINKPRRELKGS